MGILNELLIIIQHPPNQKLEIKWISPVVRKPNSRAVSMKPVSQNTIRHFLQFHLQENQQQSCLYEAHVLEILLDISYSVIYVKRSQP